jgi:flagellar biosynthesis protein FliR
MIDILGQILNYSNLQLQSFIFVLCRVGGIFLDAPLFSNQNVPVLVKIGLIIFLCIIILPFVPAAGLAPYSDNLLFLFAMAKELLIGVTLGFAARLIFTGIQIAGQLIDYQMGFGFVNIVDPESRLQVPVMGQYLYIVAIFIFLLINGHHWIIQAIVKSFQIVPLDGFSFHPELVGKVNQLISETFVIGFKIAAPLMLSLFLVDLAYGVIARAVPQANILIVGFPLKIGLGLLFAMISLPLFIMVIKRFFVHALINLNLLFKLML